MSLCLHVLLQLSVLSALNLFGFGLQNQSSSSPSPGFLVRIKLSNYSNPYQVLADTGLPCDSSGERNVCDPRFELRFGTQSFFLDLINSSKAFKNTFNLPRVFFECEHRVEHDLPDSLYLSVYVIDVDWDNQDSEFIAKPQLELANILPSVPHHSNSVRRVLYYTEVNRYVSLTIEVEITCLPGVYGRRCNEHCNGQVEYYPWNASNPTKSISPICHLKQHIPTELTNIRASQSDVKAPINLSSYYIVIGGIGAGCLIILVATVLCVISAKKRRKLERMRMLYNNRIINMQPNPFQRGESFRNPVYNPTADSVQLQQQQQQQQHQQPKQQQQQQQHQQPKQQQQRRSSQHQYANLPQQQQNRQQQHQRLAAPPSEQGEDEYECDELDDSKLPPLPPRNETK